MTDHIFNSYTELAEEGEAYKRALMTWMDDHGKASKHPWPAHVIEAKERRLVWVEKCIELFRRAALKQGEAA